MPTPWANSKQCTHPCRSFITCRVPFHHTKLPSISPKPHRCASILILIVPLALLSLGFLAHPFSTLQPLPHALPSSNTAATPSNNFPFSLPISICSFSIHCSHIHPPSNPLTFATSPV